jgi:hypothetical protein
LNLPQDGLQGRIRVRSYDIAAYKCAADDCCWPAGVQLLFHALAVGCTMAAGRIAALLVETRSGRRAIRAYEFIDASGDADLAMHAGVPYELGDGAGERLYPSTMFRIGHVERRARAGRRRRLQGHRRADGRRRRALALPAPGRHPAPAAQPERVARQRHPAAPTIEGRRWTPPTRCQLSAAEVEGRRQIVEYCASCAPRCRASSAAEIAEIAPQVGIRESRRIVGAYVLTEAETCSAVRASTTPSASTAGRWSCMSPASSSGASTPTRTTPINQLPFAMLVPPQVANLLVAGRCASMTHEGQSAARVSGGCFVMGQAAGSAAALRAAGRFHPAALRRSLLDAGVDLD